MTGTCSDLVGYFGFGSLVNKHTLRTPYVDLVPATLIGWRRHWQAQENMPDRSVALLSVHRDAETSIAGLLVIDRKENLPAVDKREEGYTRVSLSADDFHCLRKDELPNELYVYVAKGDNRAPDLPLLQSYLDAVLQGFIEVYGKAAVEEFGKTTDGFSRHILDDRYKPLYPRSIVLSDPQRECIDTMLGKFALGRFALNNQ
jgi:hypothetical protein